MIKNKKLNFAIILLIAILLIGFISSSSYSRSNSNYGAFDSFVKQDAISEKERCEAGQDFLIQIAPFGCEPAVVRSDLLEEQNVPVFCQLAATKINPLIDVEAIESISFSGEYPKEVSGISFHPARAALGVRGDLNSPILENIGYAVIVLKKEEVEDNMPEFVEGNLTARIRYDIKNAFGIGRASFYLPELTDEDFEDKKVQYSFWQGKGGYLRAETIEENSATISIYNDLRQVSKVNLEKGKTSGKISLPDFDCLANLQLKLDGIEAPDTRAKFEINGEIFEVTEGEKFLDNNCRVTRLSKKGIAEEVSVSCRTDEKTERFILRVSPKIRLDFEGAKEESYEIGDYLYEASNGKYVYLGYAGTNKDTAKEEDLYVYLIAMPEKRDVLTSSEISEVASLARMYEPKRITGVPITDFIGNFLKFSSGTFINLYKYLKDGDSFEVIGFAKTDGFLGKDVLVQGIAGPEDSDFSNKERLQKELENLKDELDLLKNSIGLSFEDPFYDLDTQNNEIENLEKEISDLEKSIDDLKDSEKEAQENYELAMNDYDRVLNSYPNEPCENEVTCGEEALYKKIVLAFNSQQMLTVSNLCEEFKSGYPKSNKSLNDYCDNKLKLANQEISTNNFVISNQVKKISFEGINEPTLEEYSAVLRIKGPNNEIQEFTLRKNQIINLAGFRDEDKNEFIQLVGLDKDKARVKFNLYAEGVVDKVKKATISSDTKIIELNVPESFGSGYVFELEKVNLKNIAKVSVLPNIDNAGTTASFPFKVGIEKRAIQLSPEKTKEKIENLEKTITDWQDKSDSLGKVVKGLKGACLATGGYLTIKNFLSNTGGKGIARSEIMRGNGGWNERCSAMVGEKKYSSFEECIFEKILTRKLILTIMN